MLALIGIGLDTKDISAKALEFLKSADIVIMDNYTSVAEKGATEFIAKATGKELVKKPRSAFEDDIKETVAQARSKTLAILVIGDPLVATTHHIILDEAHRQGIKTKVFHAPSIFSAAIGESGLDIYRFGPTTTIPFWSEKYKPISFIDVIAKNLFNSEHTLVLLDIDQKNSEPMSLGNAAETIAKADKKHVIKQEKKFIVLANIGREDQGIYYCEFSGLRALAARTEGKILSLIVPAELNFAEEDAVKRFAAT